MTTVIYTNTNLEETIKSIRALESKEKELKELRQEQEAIVKKFMDNAEAIIQIGACEVNLLIYKL